jgi:hypothetical protein
MIRDMMVQCAEKRFGTIRAPHPVQWLSDNGSIFATHKTIEIALALNLARVRMPPPPSRPLTIGWRITTPCIPIPGSATDRPGSTSFPKRCVSGLTGSTPRT